jgi:hypothetical protein
MVGKAAMFMAVLSALLAGGAGWAGPPAVPADPVIGAAGDIACDPGDPAVHGRTTTRCQMKATSDLLLSLKPAAVLALGDLQYEDGALTKFRQSYGPTWGRLKSITRPAVGNHEYMTRRAWGYYAYFGRVAGAPWRGYYSFDLGAWHLIALNSNCEFVGGCGAGSPQERWLRADLAAHPVQCTLAYWHHPRFSSGPHGSNAAFGAFWRALYEARAEIVLSGHDHSYERFVPQDPDGRADPARGIREFVVGTGGRSFYALKKPAANSAVFQAETFGVLALTLRPGRYEWTFVPAPGKPFADSGSGTCH